MKKLYLITLFLFISIIAFPQSNTKKEKIKYLLEVTKMGKQAGNEKIDYLLANLKQKYKNNADEKFWETFRKSINVDDLINLMVVIYDKYYTEDDIDQ